MAGPIEERVDGYLPRFGNAIVHEPHRAFEIRSILFEIFFIAVLHVIIVQNDKPPTGIGRNAVHPLRQRRMRRDIIERTLHGAVRAEQTANARRFGVHVADPYKAIALNAVPNIILHIEFERTLRHRKNFVYARIVALERADGMQVAAYLRSKHRFEHDGFLFLEIDPHITESRLQKLHIGIDKQFGMNIAQRMEIARILLPDPGIGFRNRFARSDMNVCLLAVRAKR